MATLRAFEVAIDLARRQRDGARNIVVQLRGQCRNAQAQLDQLAGYAAETRHRWGVREGTALQPEVLHHQGRFLQRLDQTIEMQRGVVGEFGQRIDRAVAALAATEARLESLRHVQDRRQREAQLHQQRRDQKETDELAMQRHARGSGRQLIQGI